MRLSKKSKNLVTGSTYLIVRLTVLLLLGHLIINQSHVYASDYTDLPRHLSPEGSDTPPGVDINYDQFVSNGYSGNNNAGNHTPSFRFLVYAPAGSSDVQIKIRGGATTNPAPCSYYDIKTARPVTNDDPGFSNADNGASQVGNPVDISCSNDYSGADLTGFTLTIPSSLFYASQRFGSSYRVSAVLLRTDSTSGRFWSAHVVGPGVRLSYFGFGRDGPNTSTADGASFSRTDSGYGEVRAYFAPSCNYGSHNASIYYQDADSKTSANAGHPITYRVYREGRSTPLVEGEVVSGYSSDNDVPQAITFPVTEGEKYHVTFYGVLGRGVFQGDSDSSPVDHNSNTIKIWYPFDSAAYYRDCPQKDGGDSTCEGFTKDITDNSYWRYSIFSIDSPPSVNTPYSNGAGGHTYAAANPNSGQWATFSAAPTQVVKHTPTHDYTDSQSYPQPSASGWYVLTEHWLHYDDDSSGNALYKYFYSALPFQANCYVADCGLTVNGNKPPNSSNVQAGSSYSASLLVNNYGRMPVNAADITVPKQSSGSTTINAIAPGTVTTTSIGASVTVGSWTLATCSKPVYVYRQYQLTPNALMVNFNDEDPTTLQYHSWIDDNKPIAETNGVPATVSRRLYKQGQPTNLDKPPNDSQRFNSKDYGNSAVIDNPYAINAGDQYCAETTIDHSTGWIGPGDNLVENAPATDTDCSNVVNKPFFKVYGSGISAGGGFGGGATGEIASWNNNSGTYPFGAGAQISALANGQITGFASGQSYGGTTSTKLSFANTVGVSAPSTYSPKQGGLFGAYHPLTLINAPAGATVVNGPYTLPATTISAGEDKAVFVNGDVYINGNITYGGSPWTSSDQVPSFVLAATGNIFIDPNVTNLDGIFTSQGTGKAIYTCGKVVAGGFKPLDKDALFGCNKRLTIHGSFVADRVNLMRTFGSLRDEKSVVTPPSGATYRAPTGFCFSENRNDTSGTYNKCTPNGQFSCIVPDEPANGWWGDNAICTPRGSTTLLAWGWGPSAPIVPSGWKCNKWNGVGSGGFPWNDNYLCSNNQDLYFSPSDQSATVSGTQTISCVHMYDGADPYTGGISGGAWLCENLQTSPGSGGGETPATFPKTCSNGNNQAKTCAAEIFDFSPELYFSSPAIQRPSNGAFQFDAITSLPPVL